MTSTRLLAMCCLLLAVVTTGCIPTKPVATDQLPEWLIGDWRGVGYQLNLAQTWSIELEVKAPNSVKINYPSLECSGVWTEVRRSVDHIELREAILQGADRCVNGGHIILTRVDQHHISYSFFEPQNGKLEAYSTLLNLEYEASKKI